MKKGLIFVSILLFLNGGAGENRTPVRSKSQYMFYMFSLFRIFICPKQINKPKTDYALLRFIILVRVALKQYILFE